MSELLFGRIGLQPGLEGGVADIGAHDGLEVLLLQMNL